MKQNLYATTAIPQKLVNLCYRRLMKPGFPFLITFYDFFRSQNKAIMETSEDSLNGSYLATNQSTLISESLANPLTFLTCLKLNYKEWAQ